MLPTFLPVFAHFVIDGILDDSGCAVFGGPWDAQVWPQDGVFTAPEGTSYDIYRLDVMPTGYAVGERWGVRLGIPPLDLLLLPVDGPSQGRPPRSLEMRPTIVVPSTTAVQVLVHGDPGRSIAATVTLFASRRQVQP